MLKPFYQGKLDTFCAIYAVLNALRLTHGIRTLKARGILNDTLLSLSLRPAYFSDVLNMRTDYVDLVDSILNSVAESMPLEVERPFPHGATVDEFWQRTGGWLAGSENRAVVLRFLRFLKPDAEPLNRHWTTADKLKDDVMHLFDCSHEAEAILNIRKHSITTTPQGVDDAHLLYIQPETVRFVRLPF